MARTDEHASWGRRALAAFLDGGILSLTFWLVASPIAVNTPDTERFDPALGEYVSTDRGNILIFIWTVAFYFLVIPLYFALFHGLGKGASPGKRACGLRVRLAKNPEARLGIFKAFGRQLLVQILWLFILPGIVDFLWPIFDERRRTLHDKASRTIVLRKGASPTRYTQSVSCWRCGAVNVLHPDIHRFACYACGKDNTTRSDHRTDVGGVTTGWSTRTIAPWTLIAIGGWNVFLGVVKYSFEPISLIFGGVMLLCGLIWRHFEARDRKRRERASTG